MPFWFIVSIVRQTGMNVVSNSTPTFVLYRLRVIPDLQVDLVIDDLDPDSAKCFAPAVPLVNCYLKKYFRAQQIFFDSCLKLKHPPA